MTEKETESTLYPLKVHEADLVRETAYSYLLRNDREYTIDDIYSLPDGVRAELIDGQIFFLATPMRIHQKIAGEMYYAVAHYIKSHHGTCEVYIPPFGVHLNGDESIYLEPDLTVVCDSDKLKDLGCYGAPDWVVEVLSPSTRKKDMGIKLFKYRSAGVKEYWIIDPEKEQTTVYVFGDEQKDDGITCPFAEPIPCTLFPGLKICLHELLN